MSGTGGEGWCGTEAGTATVPWASSGQEAPFNATLMALEEEEKTTCDQLINLQILHR